MDLGDHLRTFAANWWKILLIAAVAALAVFAFSFSLPATYQGFTLVNVTPQLLRDQNNVSTDTLTFKVVAFEQILKSQGIADRAAAALQKKGYHLSGTTVRNRLSVLPNGTAGLIGVEASAHSRKEAIDISNALGQALVDSSLDDQRAAVQQHNQKDLQELALIQIALDNAKTKAAQDAANALLTQVQLDEAANIVDPSQSITVAGPTTLTNNGSPVSPKPARDGLLAFLAVFVLAGEGFVIHRAFTNRGASAADVDAITDRIGLPVLARIPRGSGPDVVEAFRTLRTNLTFLEGAGQPRTIAIVSANAGAGKSFCCVNLAESAVAMESEVVVVDADLRQPVLHELLHTPREPGLTDVLAGSLLSASLHKVAGVPGMELIPSGAPVNDTVAALGARSLRKLLESLGTAELVVVDTPAGATYSDALAVAAQCDGALVVLDTDASRGRATQDFVDALRRTGASLIGVVVNGASVGRRNGYDGDDR
jgi:Mrp family chromosome partitioning ATPase/capsular polysaccharide biosynthesis protein